MKEIRLYHSSWFDYIGLLIGTVFLILMATASSNDDVPIVLIGFVWVMWIMLELLFIYRVISKILEKPSLVITDEYVKLDDLLRKSIIKFSDVHSFELIYAKNVFVGVNYNVGVKSWKDKKMNAFVYWLKSINNYGYDEVIPVSDLSLKEEAILDILNEKLENYRKKE